MKLRSVRGTHDLYGDNILKLNEIEKIVSEKAELYSFKKLQTPIFEFSELFSKPLGEQSDVVLKEMYTFKDRNNDSLTLRPEYTTPMIRAAITNNLLTELPLKIYGLGPMFRRERPQKGRYRQFNQINFEIFGSDNFIADLELIVLAHDILKKLLPKSNFSLHLNSLGLKEDLDKYKSKLSKYYEINKSILSIESRDKIFSNPLRILDSKHLEDIEISSKAPTINDFLSNDQKTHFNQLKKGLDFFGIKYFEDYKLVRGLDYYCSTVFEFKTNELGSQDTLLGGGRYDGLVQTLGGPNIPGIGWAAGIERISMLMQISKNKSNTIHLAISDKKFYSHLQKIILYLRQNEISFYWNYKYNLKKSLSKANIKNVQFVIIVGESEFKNNTCIIKKLNSGEQFEVSVNEINKIINDKS